VVTPYTDQPAADQNKFIREFKYTVDSSELVWHRDRADRIVKVISGTGWYIQMDNKLPALLVSGVSYHIPRETYHRILKGTDSLVLEIEEDK
jgi:hypothetical protein